MKPINNEIWRDRWYVGGGGGGGDGGGGGGLFVGYGVRLLT